MIRDLKVQSITSAHKLERSLSTDNERFLVQVPAPFAALSYFIHLARHRVEAFGESVEIITPVGIGKRRREMLLWLFRTATHLSMSRLSEERRFEGNRLEEVLEMIAFEGGIKE